MFCSVLFLSRPSHHGLLSPFISSSVILTDSSTESPVHDLMLSIQAVRGLPRLVHLPLFLELFFLQAIPLFPHGMTYIVCYSFLALTVSNSSLFTPALLRTHSFVFFAVHETRRIFLSLSSQGPKTCFFIPSECPAFTAVRGYRPH